MNPVNPLSVIIIGYFISKIVAACVSSIQTRLANVEQFDSLSNQSQAINRLAFWLTWLSFLLYGLTLTYALKSIMWDKKALLLKIPFAIGLLVIFFLTYNVLKHVFRNLIEIARTSK